MTKAYIHTIYALSNPTGSIGYRVYTDSTLVLIAEITVDKPGLTDPNAILAAFKQGVVDDAANNHSITLTTADVILEEPIAFQGFSKFTVWKQDGTALTKPVETIKTAVVASGTATFYLTDNGASNGNALFSDVAIPGGVQITANDAAKTISTGALTLSSDKKTLTITAKQLTLVLVALNLGTNADGVTLIAHVIGEGI